MKNTDSKYSTGQLVRASLLAALICVSTMVIKVPSPVNGYINLGDCFVLLAGWSLPSLYGFMAAGCGSSMADLFSGYAVYAPATFIIKGAVAIIFCYLNRIVKKKVSGQSTVIITGIISEAIMVSGYFLYESILYTPATALANIVPNCVQAVAGVITAFILIKSLNNKLS